MEMTTVSLTWEPDDHPGETGGRVVRVRVDVNGNRKTDYMRLDAFAWSRLEEVLIETNSFLETHQ